MHSKGRSPGTYSEVDVTRQIIDKANSVNFSNLFTKYKLNINEHNRKSYCPLHLRDGGQEHSPSFYFYPEHSSFYCFGCKQGGRPVDFVSIIEGINKYKAALIILDDFEPGEIDITDKINDCRVYLEFSHLVRQFIMKYEGECAALDHAEHITSAFDNITSKYNLDTAGSEVILNKLKKKLLEF